MPPAPERLRCKGECAPLPRTVTEPVTASSCLRNCLRLFRSCSLPFTSNDRVKFSTKQQEQTGQIHPGKQHDNGRQGEIRRIVAVVSSHINLEQFGDDDPSQRKKHSSRQRLPHRQIIFRGKKIQGEGE